MSPLEVGPTPLALTAAANIRIKDTRAKKRPSGRSDTTERVRQPCCHGREEDPDCQGRLRPWKTHIRSLTLGPTPKHTRTGLKSRIIPDHPGSSRNFHRLSSEYRTSPVFRGRTPHVPCFSPQNRLGRRNLPTSKGSFSRRITGHSCTVCRRAPNRGESRVRKTTSAQYRPQWVSVNASATPSPRKM